MRLNKRQKKHREHQVISDRSGFAYPASQIVKQWDGLLVSKDEEEPRHPQEFVTGVVDDYAVRDARPRAPYEFLISENEQSSSAEVVERDSDQILLRSGFEVITRDRVFGVGSNVILVDLGEDKNITKVLFTFTAISGNKDLLNIYTSSDNITFTEMSSPFVDTIRSFTVGEQVSVQIGRRARYVAMRFDIIESTLSPTFELSQFDIYGGA